MVIPKDIFLREAVAAWPSEDEWNRNAVIRNWWDIVATDKLQQKIRDEQAKRSAVDQQNKQNIGGILQGNGKWAEPRILQGNGKWAAPPVDPNKDPALAMPLATLHDMWIVKWGDGWVSTEALQDTAGDLSWIRAAYRLNGVGKMEHLPSMSHYRLIPLSWT